MEASRSKTAAAAASVVPFSCVICFEEFNFTTRTPMVLPCGHTFICLRCSKRLRRCMECRESLFIPGKKSTPATPSYRSGRYSPSTPPTPVQTSPPIPLPIPKNLVLLAMMEAAERQATAVEKEVTHDAGDSDDNNVSDDDEEAFDLDTIIGSLSSMAGPCGTYAVVERNGLIVLSRDPRKDHEDDQTLSSDEKKDEADSYREPMGLDYGQRIQVVEYKAGVARLARGQGYVIASLSGQLAKVGGPLDEACRLEGLLDTVSSRGKDLQLAVDKNCLVEVNLRKRINDLKAEEPTHPIIASAPSAEDILLSPSSDESALKAPTTPKATKSELSQPLLFTPQKEDMALTKQASDDSMMEVDENGVAIYSPTPTFPASPNSIDNADIHPPGMPRYRRADSSNEFGSMAYGCGTSLLGGGADALWGEGFAAVENAALRATVPINARPRASSGSPRTLPTDQPLAPPASASFDGVNFRTGMSGHRALLSNKLSRNQLTPSREVRMMSAHRGIARTWNHGSRKDSPNSSPSIAPRFEEF